MHPVLTLGKLGGDCPIRMRKGCQGGVGRHQGAPTSARVCSKVPTVLSSDPPLSSFPRFHDSIIKDSPNSRTVELTFQPHIRCHYWGTITARLVKRSGLHQYVIRLSFNNTELLFDKTELLFNNVELLFAMSSEPRLLLLAAALCHSAHHMIRSMLVCFATLQSICSIIVFSIS